MLQASPGDVTEHPTHGYKLRCEQHSGPLTGSVQSKVDGKNAGKYKLSKSPTDQGHEALISLGSHVITGTLGCTDCLS